MSSDLKENVTRRSIWLRLVFMIILAVAYGVAELVACAVIVFQFLCSLFTGQPNDRLARFGRNLARYFQQITVFMTFATEEKPFPFAPWPDEPHEQPQAETDLGPPDGKPPNTTEPTEEDVVGDDDAEDKPEDTGESQDTARPDK